MKVNIILKIILYKQMFILLVFCIVLEFYY